MTNGGQDSGQANSPIPWQAFVMYHESAVNNICGAIIIDDWTVLSSASFFGKGTNMSEFEVLAGITDRSDLSSAQVSRLLLSDFVARDLGIE